MTEIDSFKQRQEEELAVLESIYGKDITDLRKQTKEWEPLHISISLIPSQGGSHYQVYSKLDLHVRCSIQYPNEKPQFEFKNSRGVSKIELSQLQAELEEIAERCKGEVMIFELANHITHFLHKHNNPNPEIISFYDQMVLRKKQEEDNNRIILAKERDREKQVLLAEIQKRDELLRSEYSEEKDDDDYFSDNSDDDDTNSNSFKKRNSSTTEETVENCSCNSEAASIIEFSNTREYRVVHRGRCLDHTNSDCTAFNSVDNRTCELLVMYQWTIPTKAFPDALAVQKQLSGMEQEFNYLVKLNHPNLAHYVNLNWSYTNSELEVQLLREYVYGLNCKELYLSKGIPIDVEMLRCVATDILAALDYLHRHNVVHKKICDSCIYVTKRNVKLVNFSLYRRYSDITLPTQSTSSTKKTTDIYRFGMVLISLLKGVKVDEHCDIPSNTSTELYDFLSKCISKEEKQRYTARQLLEHPFITQPQERFIQTPEEGEDDASAPTEQLELLQSYYHNNSNGPSRVATEFEVLHYLGKGAFGAVIKVRNKIDQRYYAIKRIQLNPKNKQENKKIFQEVKTLSRLNHEHVVRYFNSWIETDIKQQGDSGTATTDVSVISPEPYCRNMEFTMDDGNIEKDAPPPVQDAKDWSISMRGKLKSGISESDDSDSLSHSDTLDDSDDIVFERDSNVEEEPIDDDVDTTDSVRPNIRQIQYLYIQMEFCEKSTLRTAIDDGLYKDKERVWRLLTEVVDGLIYIHKKGMIHRDLKPVNIFLNKNDNVKIGDFGLATTKLLSQTGETSSLHSSQIDGPAGGGDQPLTGNVGTALYVAPEVEKVEKDGKTLYNQKVDTYSLGIIFFEMCYKPMMTRMERYNVLKELREPEIHFPGDFLNKKNAKLQTEISKEEKIIRLLLNHDYNKRPSAQTLKNDYLPKPTLEASRIEQLVNTTLSKPNSKLYNQLISSCLNQNMTCSEDIMYDHDVEASMPPTCKYLKLYDFTRKVMIKVFKLHGGQNLPTPLLMPKNKFYDHVDSYVKLMTQWGSVVALPHDLRVPFARFLAWNEITFLRRFSVERVYRERKPTRYKDHVYKHMPRELYECAFDIVAPTPGRFRAEAELLYIFKQIIDSLPGLENEMFTIRLNHSLLVKAILRYCGINENFAEISNILSGLKDGNVAKTQVQTHLSSFGLSDKEIAAIFQLIEPEIPIDKIDTHFQMLIKTKLNPNCSAFAKQALKELKHVISSIHGFDVGMKVVITPNLLYNIQQYSGVMFQIIVQVKKGKGFVNHVVAAGGRYDAMVTYYRTVLERANLRSHDLTQSAAGISISLDKLVLALRMDQSKIDGDERYKKSNVDAVVLYAESETGAEAEWKSDVMTQLWSAGIKSYLIEKSQEELLGENGVPYKIILSDTERGIGKLERDNNSMDNRDRSISDIIEMIGSQKVYNVSRSDSRTISERSEHAGSDISYYFLPSDKQSFRLKKTDIQKHLDGVLKKLTGEIAIFTFSVQEELLRIMAAYLEVETEASLVKSQEDVIEIFRPGRQKKHVSEICSMMAEICSLMGEVRATKKKATFIVYSLPDGVYKVFL